MKFGSLYSFKKTCWGYGGWACRSVARFNILKSIGSKLAWKGWYLMAKPKYELTFLCNNRIGLVGPQEQPLPYPEMMRGVNEKKKQLFKSKYNLF